MRSFAGACGVDDAERVVAVQRCLQRLRDEQIEQVRIVWADVHGTLRGKALTPDAVAGAFESGLGMVSTLLLKDTADRTAFKVFDPSIAEVLPRLGYANNVVLLPDPSSLTRLPWAPGCAWLRAEPRFADGSPVPIDPRQVLVRAMQRLAQRGFELRCGLEVEFHVYRLDPSRPDPSADPAQADWPGPPPPVSLLHPGYQLLADAAVDRCGEALAIVGSTAQGLGLPLRSLEIELGPSQFEAVFEPADALTAADWMVAFRNGLRQSMHRSGYHATFCCRPPFPHVMSSGWHLHQSLVERDTGRNLFVAEGSDASTASSASTAAAGVAAQDVLSATGEHWLAGLLEHAQGMAAVCVATVDGFERFRPNALAPLTANWGFDNRGAMLRVVGGPGDPATRIENRIATPAANPYLVLAAQIAAGLDGIDRGLAAPPATSSPYDESPSSAARRLPNSLAVALERLACDEVLVEGLGRPMVQTYERIKRSEADRHAQAADSSEWIRREYFGRV